MPLSSAETVVIACPHCGTRYQVPPATLGERGRKVACAYCGQSWRAARPTPLTTDELFARAEEERLDRTFAAAAAAAERAASAPAVPSSFRKVAGDDPGPADVRRPFAENTAALQMPKTIDVVPVPLGEEPALPPIRPDAASLKRIAAAFERRRREIDRSLPAARLRPLLRATGVGLLVVLLFGGVVFRTGIVRAIPDLAGLYAAVGLSVNVVGLELSGVSTLLSRSGADEVLTVNATISSVENHTVDVPPVLVTLTDADGAPLYAWRVVPSASELRPGETLAFAAELPSPPADAVGATLRFTQGRNARDIPPAPAALTRDTPSR